MYINNELTDYSADSINAYAGDDIKIISDNNTYPIFNANNKDYIASIEEPFPLMVEANGQPTYNGFRRCFSFCQSLSSIPDGLFDNNPQVFSFTECFTSCTSLTSIPKSLFDKHIDAFGFRQCFTGCSNLIVNVQIGSLVDAPEIDMFAYATKATGTVYCRANSTIYEAFATSPLTNVNVLSY